jgi:hypothetical protein
MPPPPKSKKPDPPDMSDTSEGMITAYPRITPIIFLKVSREMKMRRWSSLAHDVRFVNQF